MIILPKFRHPVKSKEVFKTTRYVGGFDFLQFSQEYIYFYGSSAFHIPQEILSRPEKFF